MFCQDIPKHVHGIEVDINGLKVNVRRRLGNGASVQRADFCTQSVFFHFRPVGRGRKARHCIRDRVKRASTSFKGRSQEA
jgi:hypothetical protein